MPKGVKKNKGNGESGAASKSVFLVSVDKETRTAVVTRVPFDVANAEGETLVRTTEDAIDIISRATLENYDEEVQDAMFESVGRSFRSAVRSTKAFDAKELKLALPTSRKAKTEVDEDETEVVTETVESPLPDQTYPTY